MRHTRLCGYQPQYFPRLHYFNRLLTSDIFEISDYVQFVKKHAYKLPDGTYKRGRSFQAHTVIKNAAGPLFLAVPTKGELLPINQTAIDYSKVWVRDHLRTIEFAYRKSPNFEAFYPEITFLLNRRYDSIGDLSIATIMWAITRLITHEPLPPEAFTLENVGKLLEQNNPYRLQKIFLASQTSVKPPTRGKANEWCVALCDYAGADEYVYGGTSGSAYMNLEAFADAGIKTVLQDWKCASYQQQFSYDGFIPNLSVIDLIMNTTQNESANIIKEESFTLPKLHPSKIAAIGLAAYFEYDVIFAMMDHLS